MPSFIKVISGVTIQGIPNDIFASGWSTTEEIVDPINYYWITNKKFAFVACFSTLHKAPLPAKFRIEIDGVPFRNLSYRQCSVLERLAKRLILGWLD